MSDAPTFDHSAPAAPGDCVAVSPLIRRVIAPNPGPITFTGTCTYIVGRGTVAVVDPGPDDPGHVAALLAALAGERVSHVVVTHTHKDHSPAAALLREVSGAPIVGCGPHEPARALGTGEVNRLEASNDLAYRPDERMREGDSVEGPGWTLTAVETPGHTANHLSFALPQERALFSGDHVMAWSTTFVGPPDGSMRAYMTSLEGLLERDEEIYWPGHGGPVREPRRFVRALLHHRRQREASILTRLAEGHGTIAALVDTVYPGLQPGLRGAAALNVLAHLEDLVERGAVASAGPVRLDGTYRPA